MSNLRTCSYNIEKQATQILMSVGEEEEDQYYQYQPYKEAINNKLFESQEKKKKMRTQTSSPNNKRLPRLSISNKKQLKETLMRLEEENGCGEKQNLALQSLPLKSINLNNQVSQRKIEDIYNSRKKSQKKMRPVVIVTENTEIQVQEEKIRNLIKRKVLAKDLFRKVLINSQNQMFKHKSEVKSFQKNLLFLNRQEQRKFPYLI